MALARRTKLFKSGNSVAVRFPAAFGARAGTSVEVREGEEGWLIKPCEPGPERIDLTGIAGTITHEEAEAWIAAIQRDRESDEAYAEERDIGRTEG